MSADPAPIRTLIVDDEPLARENLRIRLRSRPEFTIVGECANGHEALRAIEAERPELLFIDIQMPELDGFEVIDRIPPDIVPVIVFVTAYDRYALDAFRVHALDYLLKPFDDDRFSESLRLARERVCDARRGDESDEALFQLSGAETGTPARPPDRLVIKTRGKVFFLKTTLIDWVEAAGDYARLHTGERSYLLRKTMHEMELRLGEDAFARISRSAIVNLDRIRELVPVSRGEFLVRLDGGQELKLTRSYRERLEERLGDRL